MTVSKWMSLWRCRFDSGVRLRFDDTILVSKDWDLRDHSQW